MVKMSVQTATSESPKSMWRSGSPAFGWSNSAAAMP